MPVGENQPAHISVLYQEIIGFLCPQSKGRYVDATLGAGGHAWGILNSSAPDGQLLGFDLDPQALALAHERLAEFGSRLVTVQASYITLLEQVTKLGWPGVHGILIDLGVSSMQLDTPERGFSFQTEGPLDMRFSPLQGKTAADLVNQYSEQDLADLIWRYGEDPQSRRIARAIVAARPFFTTRQLAEAIASAVGHKGRIHPATLTFQALRIAVNEELQAVEKFLPQAVEVLVPGGRLAVISFHSLEDRIVKQYVRRESRDCICPPEQLICNCGHQASIKDLTRHPVTATEEEVAQNPRSRSAKLRVIEKLPSGTGFASDSKKPKKMR